MPDGKRAYEVHLYRPEYSAETYAEIHWRGIIRMSMEVRDAFESKCLRSKEAGDLTTYSIRDLPEPIEFTDLRKSLPSTFRDMLGFGRPKVT